MGVDFFDCDGCGESICDCGGWWQCKKCSHRLCENCEQSKVKTIDDGKQEAEVCPFCVKKIATDTQLLEFCLKQLKTTRKKLMKEYRK